MDVTTLASIAQIISVAWFLFFGSKTCFEVARALRKKRTIQVPTYSGILATLALLVCLASFSRGQPLPAPTSPSHQLLYQALWRNSTDGWVGSEQWKPSPEALVVDGATPLQPQLISPYEPETLNFALEVRFHFIKSVYAQGDYLFGVEVRGDRQGNADLCGSSHVSGRNSASLLSHLATLEAIPQYTLDTTWHTYRVEVQGDRVACFLDGQEFFRGEDDRHLSGELLALEDEYAVVEVANFQVMTL